MNTRLTTVLLLVLFALPVVLFADEKPKKKASEDKNALQVPLKIRQLQKQLEETEEKIKELAKATIRCIPFNNPLEEGKCILTGKPSKQRVVFARAY